MTGCIEVRSLWVVAVAAMFCFGCSQGKPKEAAVADKSGADKAAAPRQDPKPGPKAAAFAPAAELLPNGKKFSGYVVGGQPSAEQFEKIASSGYRTVINLRHPSEDGSTDAKLVQGLKMSYVAIPIASAEELNEENARKLDAAMKAADGPVVVHCASGNRVGALFGLKAAVVDGLDADAALALAKAHGATSFVPALSKKLER